MSISYKVCTRDAVHIREAFKPYLLSEVCPEFFSSGAYSFFDGV